MGIRSEAMYLTPEEYLEQERNAEWKSEYHDGIIVQVPGATWAHSLITSNIDQALGSQLRGSDYRVVSKDQRVRVTQCNRYFYPDVIVVRRKPRFDDRELYTLLDPILVVEVLSDSTEKMDRGVKFACYQMLESLAGYVLVTQDQPRVEIFTRAASAHKWEYTTVTGLDASARLEVIGCAFCLADVEFPEPPR